MKKIILMLALMVGFINSDAQISSASLTASGLTCSMCSKSIYKALSQLDAVQSVSVDLDKSVFTINFKPNVIITPDDIKKAVTDAGFAVASLKITANFPATEVENDKHIQFEGATYHLLNVSKKSISGVITFTVLDKNFVTNAEFRRNKKFTKMKCYETGRAESCCHSGVAPGSRIYHITF
jgi:copper chaperone CopZ